MDLTEEGFKMKIEVCHVEKSLKGREVLKDISCVMESGKIYGLYGHNGSGKTMLMRCILGLIHIDHGNIIIDGKNLEKTLIFHRVLELLLRIRYFSLMQQALRI